MGLINSFFTSNTGQSNFVSFGIIHIILLIIAMLGGLYILTSCKENRKLELAIGGVLILQQASLYLWYIISNYNVLKEGLPLYHCRISILLIGIGLLFNKKILMKIGSYWGIIGSILALLFPNVDPFVFPHITQFSFFIGHLFLLWGSLYILCVKNIGFSNEDFKIALIFTNVYHILMFILNNRLASNYGYMNTPPISMLNGLNLLVYRLGVILTFNLILCVEYLLINRDSIRDFEITDKSFLYSLKNN